MSTQPAITVNSEPSLQSLLGTLRSEFARHKYLRVSYRIGKARSSKQNRHSHAWYSQLERELPENNAAGWKAFCKLHFAVPIMRAEEAEFREMYDKRIKPHSYETKLLLMEWMPVTSLMTKAQLKKYEEAVQTHFRDQHGVELTYEASE